MKSGSGRQLPNIETWEMDFHLQILLARAVSQLIESGKIMKIENLLQNLLFKSSNVSKLTIAFGPAPFTYPTKSLK